MRYLILQHPGHNRVFYQAAKKMALAELTLMCQQLSCQCTEIQSIEISGVHYLSFVAQQKLNAEDLIEINRFSFIFAFFAVQQTNAQTDLVENILGTPSNGTPSNDMPSNDVASDDAPSNDVASDDTASDDTASDLSNLSLIPIALPEVHYIHPKISSLLKYRGKTNELFTKMMIHIAMLSSDYKLDSNTRLLDPIAGRGTTLYEASFYGMHAYGIEIEPKSVQEATLFFRKYLETEHIKHKLEKRAIAGQNKLNAQYIHDFKYALSKEEMKDEKLVRHLAFVGGRTQDAKSYFKKAQFHLIVGDLPYGVLHGNKNQGSDFTRNPTTLLTESIGEWKKVLLVGGVVVMAWNAFLINRHKMIKLFEEAGYQVLNEPLYQDFEHMVDQSIKRDIIVAKRLK